MFPRDRETAAHEETPGARYPKGSLPDSANGTELVGICVKLACTEEPRCYSPEGNLQGNKLSILERHHVFPRGWLHPSQVPAPRLVNDLCKQRVGLSHSSVTGLEVAVLH